MKLKQAYIDIPTVPHKKILNYFAKPGRHCNESDMDSPKWEPPVHYFPCGPRVDETHIMMKSIYLKHRDRFDLAPDCSKQNQYECKKRRHLKCSATDPHFPAHVKKEELVQHLKQYHPLDYEEFLESVKFTLENKLDFKLYNDNSKKDLKLSKGIIHEEKSIVIRLPRSRRNPIRPDQIENDIDLSSSSSSSSPWPMKIKEEYQDNLVGAYAGNYDRPIGSESYKKFYNFTNYRHEPSKMCFIYDINLSKYEMLDTKDKINSYFIKEDATTSTIVGPATQIEKESLLYTCKRHRCIFPCLCVSCVLQTSECSEHKFKHPDLFDIDNDRLLLRTPHNYKISDIRKPNNTFRKCYIKDKSYVDNKYYLGYEEPVVQMYVYAGIKKDCDTCSNDLYNHSAYHFIFHDNCKFCRFSAHRFDGITTREEFCIRIENRFSEENSSCCLCNKIFSSEKIKDDHIKNVHQNGGDFLCDECGRIFASKVALEYHLKSLHRVEEQWMCKHCKKTFNMKHSLNVHVRNVHSMKTFVCKICSKVFSRLSHFIRHAKYVHGEHRNYFVLDDYPEILYYKCDQCSFQSRYNTNLHKHIATIHKDITFSCNMCTFISNRQDNLQRHVTTLHSNAKYQCSECEFVSNRNDNFNRHIHTIHGEEKFTCDKCDFTTNRNDNLLRHIDFVHGEEIRYSCSECDFICHVEKNMKEHMEIVHFEEYKCVFNCHECNFVTDSSDCLKKHLETKHSVKFEEFNCNDCNFVSKWKNKFKRHIETVHKKEEKFKCDECNFVSYRSDKLNRHIQTVHNKEKKFNCKLCIYACNRKDNMKRHIEKVHSGDVKSNLMSADTNKNLLVCEECNKSFLKKDDYKRHLALHNNLDKTWIPNNNDVDLDDLDDLEKTMETQVEVGKENPEDPAQVLKETEG